MIAAWRAFVTIVLTAIFLAALAAVAYAGLLIHKSSSPAPVANDVVYTAPKSVAVPERPRTAPRATPKRVAPVRWGSARASSFWDPATASGRPMESTTIASPYLPIGTKVSVRANGKTVAGTVTDFGPADWVMASDPTRFLDLAEPMMLKLSGTKSNVIGVEYSITKYGTGAVYRPGAAMTAKLKTHWRK